MTVKVHPSDYDEVQEAADRLGVNVVVYPSPCASLLTLLVDIAVFVEEYLGIRPLLAPVIIPLSRLAKLVTEHGYWLADIASEKTIPPFLLRLLGLD